MPEEKSIAQDDKIWGLLSYLWVVSFIALAMKKNNAYVRFHASQGALLCVISLAGLIPVLGQIIAVIVMIFAIIGMIKAYNGEKWPLPVIGKQAKEFGDWLVKTLNF